MFTDAPFVDLNSAVAACQSKVEQIAAGIAADRDKFVSDLAIARATIDQDEKAIADLHAQLTAINSKVVYRDLQFNPWSQNSDAAVGGTGLGKATQTRPGSDGWATFRNEPDAPIAPATNNEFDCYNTKTFPPDPTKKTYRLSVDWRFKTLKDANACRCLEMEARPIIVGGMMFVIACQLNFASKLLRVYEGPADATSKGHWFTTPVPIPLARFVPGTIYTVVLDGHRDDTTVYTDAVTINGTVYKIGTQYPAFDRNWGPFIKCSLQLDSDYKSGAYEVDVNHVNYELS